MRNSLKRFTAGILAALMMVLVLPSVVFGESEVDPAYLPLRMVFESHNAQVLWGEDDNSITVEMEGANFVFTAGSNEALLNGEAMELNFPVAHLGERTYISLFDVMHLFAHPSGEFTNTIMDTVATAYQLMELMSVTGMGIAIVDAETGFTWTRGFGFADTQNNLYVNENTVFALASISKTFTAIAVMQLVEQGIIDLDTPVVEYLPDFYIAPSPLLGGDYRNITVRMLLTHTSGIMPALMGYGEISLTQNPDYMNNFLANLANYSMISPEDMLFSYNNNGFNLLGVLVASVTGADDIFYGFANYMAENVFAPAGMNNSGFIVTADYIAPYLANAYTNSFTPDEISVFNGLPTGGMFASTYDMANFMHIFLSGGGDVLGADYIAQMHQVHDFDFSASMGGMRYGLGLMNQTSMDNGFQFFGHGGNLIEFHSEMSFDVDSGIGVFVTTNSATGIFIAQAAASGILARAVFEKTGELPHLPIASDFTATPIEVPSEELAAYTGVFLAGNLYTIIELDENGNLQLVLPAMFEIGVTPIVPLSDGSFQSDVLGRMWFEVVEGVIVLARTGHFNFHLTALGMPAELFYANEEFEAWVGTFMPVNEGDNRQNIAVVSYGIDEFGFAFSQTQTLNLLNLTSALQIGNDNWLMLIDNVERDENGRVIAYETIGQRFERVQ